MWNHTHSISHHQNKSPEISRGGALGRTWVAGSQLLFPSGNTRDMMCSLPGGFPAVIEVGIPDSCIPFVGWGWKYAHMSLFSRNSASLWVLGLEVGYPEVHYDKERTQVHGVRSIPLLIFPYFKVQSWEGSTANWRIFSCLFLHLFCSAEAILWRSEFSCKTYS